MQRQQGWHEALKLAVQYLRDPFFRFQRGYILRKSLIEPIDIPPSQVTVTIRQVTPDDSELLETIVPPLRVKWLFRKMQAGEIGCIAIQEQKVIAYVFAAFAGTPSAQETHLDLGPREAYLWAGFALPEFRRQGVVRAVNLNLCRILQNKGYESAVLLVERRNQAALGHVNKMGYYQTDRIAFLKILKWAIIRIDPIDKMS